MDIRKKQISELEQQKRELMVSLDAMLTRLGEALLGRAADSTRKGSSAFEELDVFKRLKSDIAGSETAIQAVEEQIRRFRELEESIETKEQEESSGTKELAAVYGKLGKLLLDTASGSSAMADSPTSGDGADFCAPYRDQADALLTKVLSLDERLSGLEDREGGNVFTWIGKNAQGLVLRSFLTKAQENLEQLRRNVGERYSRRDMVNGATLHEAANPEETAIEELCAEIEHRRTEANVLLQDLTDLKEERRTISGSFNAEGGPLKQIQTLKKHIAHVRDELKSLYRRIGEEAALVEGTQRRKIIDSLTTREDKEDLDAAVRTNQMIRDNEKAIEKLQASLSIDEEKEKIEKYRKMIQDKKDKIVQAESSIMEFEESIRVSEASIEKLKKLL
jgi:tetratricopeptide (TPR) repeat protein